MNKLKILALSLTLSLATLGKAEVTQTASCNCLSTTLTFASNYIYRAMSYNSQGASYQSQGSPVAQASLDFTKSGLSVSLFTGNADSFNTKSLVMEKDSEFDTFLSYSHPVLEWASVGVGYNYYSFLKNVDNDMQEFNVTLNVKNLSLYSGYIDRYSGVDTNHWRSTANYVQPILERLNLVGTVGYTKVSNPYAVATTSYYDYRVGVQVLMDGFKSEINYTNTWNRVNPYTELYSKMDGTFTVVLSKTLSVL
jgi:uncharacterized protein (TIGR02001 family)